jgi:hypothetical protein
MKKQAAEDICRMVEEVIKQMQILNNYVLANCEHAEIKRIAPAVALCVGELDTEILVPIHREYPGLKPTFLP